MVRKGATEFTGMFFALWEKFTVRRILCVPYYPDDVKTAIAAKEIYDAPMCTFLMDDQNIFARGIDDVLMKSLLEKSALRLAISPELRDAYQAKYMLPFWYMPPVVPDALIPSQLVLPNGVDSGNPVMIVTFGRTMAEPPPPDRPQLRNQTNLVLKRRLQWTFL